MIQAELQNLSETLISSGQYMFQKSESKLVAGAMDVYL